MCVCAVEVLAEIVETRNGSRVSLVHCGRPHSDRKD